MGAANSGRAATGRKGYSPGCGPAWGKLQARGRAETTSEAEFREPGTWQSLSPRTRSLLRRYCAGHPSRGRGGGREVPPAGTGSGEVTEWQEALRHRAHTGFLARCVFAASAFAPLVSRLSPPPHSPRRTSGPQTRQRAPRLRSACVPPEKNQSPGGCKSVRPVPTSPYTADWATKYRVAIPPAARGNSAQVQGEASPGPPPRRPWPGPASAQPFPPAFSPPRPPPPPALGFKSQRLRSAVGRRGLRAPEAWPRSCPRAEPRPRTPVPPSPPSLPRPALPEYPSP